MNIQSTSNITSADYLSNIAVNGQGVAGSDTQSPTSDKYADQVTLTSPKTDTSDQNSGMKYMRFNSFGGPSTHLPPVGAGRVEEWAYRRESIPIDSSTKPATFKDTGNPVNYQEWLAKEKEIDTFVEKRIAIYNASRSEGLSDEEIIKRLKAFNDTVPEKYYNFGEPYAEGYKVPPYDTSASAGSIEARRQKSYKMMTNYLAYS